MMLKPFGFNRADTGGGDVTAPTLSSPVDAANGATAATGSVDTNEGNGTLYWVVTQSATSPSAAQVKAGNDHTGSAGDDSGSQSVSGTGTQTLSPAPSGLTASTTYYIHYMHEDAATNQSSVSSADGFTTDAASSAFTDDFSTYSVSDTLDSKAAYNKISPFYNLVVASGAIVQTNGPNDNEETDVEVNQTFSTDHYVEATGRFTTTGTSTSLRVVVSSDGTDYCWVAFNSDGTVYIEDTTTGFINSLTSFTPNTGADQVFRVEATQSTDTIEAFVDAVSLGSDTNALYDKGGTSGGIGIFMQGGTTAADCHWVDIEVGDQ